MSDWIKLRSDLDTDPRVYAMGELLRQSAQSYILTSQARDLFGPVTDAVTGDVLRDVTLSALCRVWFAANRHTTDGVFKNASLEYLDTLAKVPGFGRAMAAVGYAVHDETARTVTLPRFEEYNAPNKNGQRSKSAGARRTAEYRQRLKEAAQTKDSGEQTPPLKKKESDASSDVTGDVTSSISSSSSKSTEGTPSDSEKTTANAAQRPSDPLGTLKTRINALRPSWSKAQHWTAEEESALFESRHNLLTLEDQDWRLLAWFFKFAHSPANTSQRDAVPVTTRRHKFCAELSSYLDRATTAWKQNGSPKLTSDATKPRSTGTPAPSEPPPAERATSASFAAALQAQGGQLPPPKPAPPNVAALLLADLGLPASPSPSTTANNSQPSQTSANAA